jgi:hypothetical protein
MAKALELTIWFDPTGSPGSTTSFPVARIATPGHVHRGGKADIPRRHQPPGGDTGFTLFEIDAREPDVAVTDAGLEHGHPVARNLRVLLDHDGVRSVRKRSTREDTHRLARSDPALESAAGLNLPHATQDHGRFRHVLGTDGIAVHRRHRGRRLGHPRADILRRHAPQGIGQRHQFRR